MSLKPEFHHLSDSELQEELKRRQKAREKGKCDVCGNWYDEPSCGNVRHWAAEDFWYRRWKIGHRSNWLDLSNEALNMTLQIPRYGTQISLYPLHGGVQISKTNLPSNEMSDQDRIKWAVQWAEEDLRQ